ncbi:ABC transporter permease [Fodinicurvata halophila]|uniref:ABC transporter permease n=1 Tax=Fodinicurvata halophila TaxID=1419723 RepID=A0ABV8UM06_9PROT
MNLQLVIDSLPQLLDGLGITLQITVLSVFLGLILAIPSALLRLSPNPLLRWPAYAYIFYFRGTPLLVQLFLIYYGGGQFRAELEAIGLWTYFREAYFCAVLTLTLNTGAYTAEILRGSIQAVPHGEVEAARACGMSGWLLHRRIILPKAFRLALPAYSNEVIFLFQATSLVSIITILDLTGVARSIVARTFAVYEIYITAGLIYLACSYGILFIFKHIERRLMAHLRPEERRQAEKAADPGQENLPV